jgi:hypothetical protein
LNSSFLGTAAPVSADLILLLEMAMGVGLLIGALLARLGRFREHAWCQSSIVLLNLSNDDRLDDVAVISSSRTS